MAKHGELLAGKPRSSLVSVTVYVCGVASMCFYCTVMMYTQLASMPLCLLVGGVKSHVVL